MKNNKHSLIIKGVMVLLSLVVLIFIGVYGWFISADQPAVASGISAKTDSNISFDMAIGFESPDTAGDYMISNFSSNSNSIDFKNIVIPRTYTIDNSGGTTFATINNNILGSGNTYSYNLLSNFEPVDLTGDGVDLYRPEMTYMNRKIDYTKNSVDKDITDNKQYISFDLYVRSDERDFKVSLDSGSYVVAACEVSNDDLETLADEISDGTVTVDATKIDVSKLNTVQTGLSEIVRKSSYGDFSEDSVIGATRIAFTQYAFDSNANSIDPAVFFSNTIGLDSSKSQLWIPRSDIYLQDTQNIDDWTLYTSSSENWSSGTVSFNADEDFGKAVNYYGTENSRSVKYSEAAAEHWYYDETKISQVDYKDRYTKVDDVITEISDTDDTVIINGLSNLTDGNYYYGKCHICLWIEGCDAEARKAIDGGSFFFGFDLSAK